jgi:hypothetical protein
MRGIALGAWGAQWVGLDVEFGVIGRDGHFAHAGPFIGACAIGEQSGIDFGKDFCGLKVLWLRHGEPRWRGGRRYRSWS